MSARLARLSGSPALPRRRFRADFEEPDPGLAAFESPISPIPERIARAIAAGVVHGTDARLIHAGRLPCPTGDGLADGVFRNRDGTLTVACRTELPKVTPAMCDWWFGWHIASSARYRLWHPTAHVSAIPRENRAACPDDRSRYVGNTSFVEERIGDGPRRRLAISFLPPESLGLDPASVDRIGTAICARIALAFPPVEIGWLAHLVRATKSGSEMCSRFWLGHVGAGAVPFGSTLGRVANRPGFRRRAVPDRTGLELLRHCAEEMSHLARLLPPLHRDRAGPAHLRKAVSPDG